MIPKAIRLLYRWLAHDVPDGSDDGGDLTLDDETNDLLLAYPVPRAEHDQAVLDAVSRAPELMLRTWEHASAFSDPSGQEVARACIAKAELDRRKAKAEADAISRGLTAAAPEVRARARDALRRLESLR